MTWVNAKARRTSLGSAEMFDGMLGGPRYLGLVPGDYEDSRCRISVPQLKHNIKTRAIGDTSNDDVVLL